jgi:hypothetical protein
MNKFLSALLLSALLLASCAGDPGASVTDPSSDTAGSESTAAPAEFAGFALTVQDVRLLPGVTVGVDTLLGTPLETLEAPSCIHEGNDTVFLYEGLEIVTSPSDNGNYVVSATVTSETLKTEEGIGIGSALADVTAVYGEWDADLSAPDFGRYVFVKAETSLTLLTDADEVVTSIVYAVEEQ